MQKTEDLEQLRWRLYFLDRAIKRDDEREAALSAQAGPPDPNKEFINLLLKGDAEERKKNRQELVERIKAAEEKGELFG